MEIQIGMKDCFAKTISEYDVYGFAGIVGDFNEAHINKVAAEKGIFKKQIAHGMLVGSLISTVLGTKLPGNGTIYMEQNVIFKKPVYIGDTCKAIAEVVDIINESKGIYKLNTIVVNQDDVVVVEGYAIVKYKGAMNNE